MNRIYQTGCHILKKNTVIFSVNNDEGNLCLDIFIRENKTFGFEEFRKDPENINWWYKIGNYGDKIYLNQKPSQVYILNVVRHHFFFLEALMQLLRIQHVFPLQLRYKFLVKNEHLNLYH